MKKLETSDIIQLIGIFVALMFSVWGFIRGCQQENKIDKLNYQVNSMNYRPLMEIIGDPFFKKLFFSPAGIPIEKKPRTDQIDSLNKMIIFDFQLGSPITFEVDIKFTNTGNSIGKIRNTISECSIKEDHDIRKTLIEESDKFTFDKYDKFPTFMKTELLNDGKDTLNFNTKAALHNLGKDQQFIFHFLLIYENELGGLYDTYYKIKCELRIITPNPFRDEKFLRGDRVTLKLNYKDIFQVKKYKTTYYTYNLAESERTKKFFDNWKRKLKKE